ncbi:hypothetical protein LC593_31815 [Nostoc sp. CHAB 5844]|nr:hypothetical protein [Nostoc sp. CHAB 5844]
MKADDRIIFRVNGELKKICEEKAKLEGRRLTDVLKSYLEAYAAEMPETAKINELEQRLIKLEEKLMGESAA